MRAIFEIMLVMAFWGCLFRAAWEDGKSQMVRRWLWWVAGGAGIVTLLLRRGAAPGAWSELACYGVIQFLLFSKMYGKADCHAFLCCGIMMSAYGGGMKDFLWHMLITFSYLGIIQIGKRNVTTKGNLRQPVALIPYVVPAYFTCILLGYLRVYP